MGRGIYSLVSARVRCDRNPVDSSIEPGRAPAVGLDQLILCQRALAGAASVGAQAGSDDSLQLRHLTSASGSGFGQNVPHLGQMTPTLTHLGFPPCDVQPPWVTAPTVTLT